MSGLSRILRLHGQMSITDDNGKKVVWVWDYANEKPRIKKDMTKEEQAASEKAKWSKIKEQQNKEK